jgi:hypothetical protein
MTIKRMDRVGIVVDDLAAATRFFVERGSSCRARGQPKATGWIASWGSTASGRTSR